MKIGKVMKKLPDRFTVRAARQQHGAFYESLESLKEGEYLPIELSPDQCIQSLRNRVYNLNRKKGSTRFYRSMIDPDNELIIVIWWETKK